MASRRQPLSYVRGSAFRNNPGLTAVVVISLALGIGANTAVFSVVDAVFFKSFPIRDPARVVTIVTRHPDYRFDSGFDYPVYRKLRGECGALIDVAAHYHMQIDVGTPAGTERTEGALARPPRTASSAKTSGGFPGNPSWCRASPGPRRPVARTTASS